MYIEKSFLGAGVLHLALYDDTGVNLDGIKGEFQDTGNISSLTVGLEFEEKTVQNYRTCGGGEVNSVERITAVTGSFTVHDYTAQNWAKAFRGSITDVASGAVTDEEHACWGGSIIPFDFMPDTSVDYVVTDDLGTTTYVKNTDYYEVASGIEPISTGSMPTDGSTIKVDYTKHASQIVQALATGGVPYRAFFAGLNEMQSCQPMNIDIYRMKIQPVSSAAVISGDPGEITLEFKALLDPNKGTGSDGYFRTHFRA